MNRLLSLLDEGIAACVFPGAAFAVGGERGTWFGYRGRHTYDPESRVVDEGTLWDLASLTKVLATTPAAMLLVQDRRLELDTPVVDLLPEFRGPGKEGVTLRRLLTHSSGLPAYADVTCLRGRDEAWPHICGLPLAGVTGAAHVYSCLGFVVLWQAIERVVGATFDEFLDERLFRPLAMSRTGFRPTKDARVNCAPTASLPTWQKALEDERGFDRVQEDFIQGDVHDPIACVMGGVSGNAGLFSNAGDVAKYLRHCAGLDPGPLSSQSVSTWSREQETGSGHCLGWIAKSPTGSSAGDLFSSRSFGHTGYTGTSAWIDPERRFFAALLTNRVHPDDRREGMAAFRPRFHDAVYEFLQSLAK